MSSAKSRTRTSGPDIRVGLIAAGRKILERDGVAGLTVRAVAAEAGVAPMGVYNHFDGKEGLIDAVVTDGFAEFASAIAATDDDPALRLSNSGRAYRTFALANPVLYSLMFSSECEADLEVAARGFLALADIIRYGQVAGRIISGDANEFALQAWSCVHGAVALELAGSAPPFVDTAANFEHILELIARGLAP
ncbi:MULTISPECIES: TetR/AcrR family transcriptional regulator [unclassified Gordonia (in: high G+C Gram-positive bacteria)]|uniref:TetR/AcrR family transcriptional regulator n=1 Tax=unclassified Gordonia (in: high G+C Gram-positive bacteria) TaxID=2657482 RepID=UPI001F0F13E0|nr:TetR/AcrR family transcriptional regulator [Gordonia sp. ABSL49_1]MCH5643347.1 TetR/AcrR family transcriptional regulator [Gordonia sp. ABSL49_1]